MPSLCVRFISFLMGCEHTDPFHKPFAKQARFCFHSKSDHCSITGFKKNMITSNNSLLIVRVVLL